MKVKELIEKLQACDPEGEVRSRDHWGEWGSVDDVLINQKTNNAGITWTEVLIFA